MTSRRDWVRSTLTAFALPRPAANPWVSTSPSRVDQLGSSDIFNVRSFGAVGDGRKDDTLAIQKAIDGARNARGGLVFVPAGTYRVTAPLVLRSQVSLLGVGRPSSLMTSDVKTNVVSGTNISDVVLEGLQLQGGGKDQTDDAGDGGNGIQLQGVSRVRIVGCWLERFDDAIFAADSSSITVAENHLEAVSGAGVRWLNVSLGAILSNEMDGARDFGNKKSAVNMVWLSATPNGYTNRCIVAGNRGINFSFEGILVIAHHNLICDNVIESALNGVNCQSGSEERTQPVVGGSYNTISENLFRNTRAQVMRVGNSSGSNEGGTIGLDLAGDTSSNTSRGDSFSGTSSHGIGLGAHASWNQIVDPTVIEAAAHGILIQGGVGNSVSGGLIRRTQQDGIRVSGSPDRTRITGVTVVDADAGSSGSYGGIVVLGGRSAYVAHNRSFVTEPASYQLRGLVVSRDAKDSVILGNDFRGNRNAVSGMQVGDETAVVAGNLDGAAKL